MKEMAREDNWPLAPFAVAATRYGTCWFTRHRAGSFAACPIVARAPRCGQRTFGAFISGGIIVSTAGARIALWHMPCVHSDCWLVRTLIFFCALRMTRKTAVNNEEKSGESTVRQPVQQLKLKKPKPSRQIKMDCIRDLIGFSHQSSHQGGRRVVVIEPAEAMNRNTANALLKTLEEPGENFFLILVSHQSSRLLPTLRSRCQSLLCATPSLTDVQRWLAHFISPERATFALSFCGDAPLRALRAVNEGDDTHYQQMRDILVASQSGSMNYLQAGEALAKNGCR